MFLLFITTLSMGIFSHFIFSYLLKIKNTPQHWLRPWLFVSSRKSHSDAILLGGLVINFVAISSIVLTHFLFSYPHHTLLYSIPSLLIILIHGYLDDRFEISPRFKLLCQLFSVALFAALTIKHLPISAWIGAPLLMIAGFAVLNGANLLDGLDTMQMKLSTLSLVFYLAVAIQFREAAVTVASAIAMSSLIAFYPFNREPAKIHMGEIGANTVGMLFLVLSTELFIGVENNIGPWNSFVIASIPLALPVVELSTSFLRRIMVRKSPFKSDRLHLHHLLIDQYHFSAGGSATLVMAFFALIGAITLVFSKNNPLFAFAFEYISLYVCYWRVGFQFWTKNVTTQGIPYNAKMTRLKKRQLTVIDSSTIDHFQMTFHQQTKVDHAAEIENIPQAS